MAARSPEGGRISGGQLLRSLERDSPGLLPAYLLAGENLWLRDRILERLRDLAVPPEWRSTCMETIWADEIPEAQAAEMSRTPPFGAARRLLIIRGVEAYREEKKKGRGRRSESKSSPLADYLGDPEEFTILAMTAESWPVAKWERDGLGRAALAAGCLAECARLQEPELRRWLAQEAARQGVRAEPEALGELVERCRSDPLILAREMEKLACYAGEGRPITAADVQALTGEEASPPVFRFLDALFVERTPGRALGYLARLLSEAHPLYLHAIMLTQMRKLVMLKAALAQGLSIGQIAGRVKLPPGLVSEMKMMVLRTPASRFAELLREMAEGEFALKRVGGGNELERARRERGVLEGMVLKLCR